MWPTECDPYVLKLMSEKSPWGLDYNVVEAENTEYLLSLSLLSSLLSDPQALSEVDKKQSILAALTE